MDIDTAIYLRLFGYIGFLITPFVFLFISGVSRRFVAVLIKYALSIIVMYLFIVVPLYNLNYQLDHIVESLDRNQDGWVTPDEKATWTSEEIRARDKWVGDGARNVFGYFVSPIFASIYCAMLFGVFYAVRWCARFYQRRANPKKFHILKKGMKIKFISIPTHDLKQFEKTHDNFTTSIFQKIIDEAKILTITEIDEYGYPWFEYNFINEDGEKEYHSIAIMDDDGWILV